VRRTILVGIDECPTDSPLQGADNRLQLTPAQESAGRFLLSSGSGKFGQQEFDDVGRLRNVNLVTTDDRRDHYWVAVGNSHVYPTGLRYFWGLAKGGRL
jgi:hypothetical protein